MINNFLKRVETLVYITTQNIEIFKKDENFSRKYCENEYNKLVELTDNDQEHKKLLLQLNPNLCRYKDIYPYIDNCITIKNERKQINASWINIPLKHTYIAAQGPNDNTIEDFWQMCFDYNVNVIVMLCNEFENGVKKCSNYWDEKDLSEFTIIKTLKPNQNNDIIEREITIRQKSSNLEKTFHHIQFKGWPDHNTPNPDGSFYIFESLFEYVEKFKGKSPVVIHCSAGIGRTGVFATVQILYNEIMSKIKTGKDIQFNIFNTVRKIKECRLYSVDNIKQYSFIYQLIEELLKKRNVNPKSN